MSDFKYCVHVTKKIGIYQIISKIDLRTYIGQSINIDKRWKEHLNALKANRHDNPLLQNYFNKHGQDNLSFSIKEVCAVEELTDKEQFYLDLIPLNSRFNLGLCADNPTRGRKMPPISEETREKYRIRSTGRKLSEETKERMARLATGRHHSQETKQKISFAHKGRKRPSWVVETYSKKIEQLSKDGQSIAIYKSTKEASLKTGIWQGNISSAALGDRLHSAGGFLWRYLNE